MRSDEQGDTLPLDHAHRIALQQTTDTCESANIILVRGDGEDQHADGGPEKNGEDQKTCVAADLSGKEKDEQYAPWVEQQPASSMIRYPNHACLLAQCFMLQLGRISVQRPRLDDTFLNQLVPLVNVRAHAAPHCWKMWTITRCVFPGLLASLVLNQQLELQRPRWHHTIAKGSVLLAFEQIPQQP